MALFTMIATGTTGVLTEAMLQVVQNGFDSLSATVGQVLTISVPAAVGIIALTGGVKYALKKVRGVIASAA